MNRTIVALAVSAAGLLALAAPAAAHRPPKGADHIVLTGAVDCRRSVVVWTVGDPTLYGPLRPDRWATTPTATPRPGLIAPHSSVTVDEPIKPGETATATVVGVYILSDRLDTQSAAVVDTCPPSPTTTTASSTTTVTTTSVSSVGSVVPPQALASTGANPTVPVAFALALLTVGGTLALVRRPRETR